MIPMLLLLSRIMTRPLKMTLPYSMKIFAVKTFANCPGNRRIRESFHLRKIPASRYADSHRISGKLCICELQVLPGFSESPGTMRLGWILAEHRVKKWLTSSSPSVPSSRATGQPWKANSSNCLSNVWFHDRDDAQSRSPGKAEMTFLATELTYLPLAGGGGCDLLQAELNLHTHTHKQTTINKQQQGRSLVHKH